MLEVERRSELGVPAETAWAWAISLEEINDELRPWLRMTMPAALRGVELEELPVGRSVGRSWILLLGLIPVDYDDLCLEELEPPSRFRERSRTLTFDPWIHERVVEPAPGGGCVVIDRLGFELKGPLRRLPGGSRLATAIVGFLFSHRHRRLRRRAGVA